MSFPTSHNSSAPHHSPISSSDDDSDLALSFASGPVAQLAQEPRGTSSSSSPLKSPSLPPASSLIPVMSRQVSSPSPSLTSQQGQGQSSSTSSVPVPSPGGSTTSYPPHHPLYQSKHSCSICGDRASGKHYGVYSCEGCKGFFKRTVRKDLTYACREERNCIVDKRQRNRCQYCRYQKCLSMGMRREAVQEERMRSKEKRQRQQGLAGGTSGNVSGSDSDLEGAPQSIPPSTPTPRAPSSAGFDFSLEKLQAADKLILAGFLNNAGQIRTLDLGNMLHHQPDTNRQLVEICEKELHMAIQYARMCPFIGELPLADQVALIKCAWNELHLSAMGARAMFANAKNGLVLSSGLCITPQQASLFGLSGLVERMAGELISKMSELQVDHFELSCLRGIILFNPDAKGLINADKVEACRERLYSALEDHCQQSHPTDISRFAKLLLRLPSLRSIGLKCLDLLFFSQLFPNLPLEGFLTRLIPQPNRDLRAVAMEVENDEFQRRLRSPLDPGQNPSPGFGAMPNADFFAALAGNTAASNSTVRTQPQQQPENFYAFPQENFVKQEPPNSFS